MIFADTLTTGWILPDCTLWFTVEELIEIYYNDYKIIELIHVGRYDDDVIIVYEVEQ